jgi:hypothetical protein
MLAWIFGLFFFVTVIDILDTCRSALKLRLQTDITLRLEPNLM